MHGAVKIAPLYIGRRVVWQITKLHLRITGVGGLTERGAFLAAETQTWRRKSGKEEKKK